VNLVFLALMSPSSLMIAEKNLPAEAVLKRASRPGAGPPMRQGSRPPR